MKITITINTDNAAFEPYPQIEASNILADVIRLFDKQGIGAGEEHKLYDHNGNVVGNVKITEG